MLFANTDNVVQSICCRDIKVIAHELGHNFGAGHTHNIQDFNVSFDFYACCSFLISTSCLHLILSACG